MSAASDRQGGCQCGAIRSRLLRAPVALYACHCLNCQKQSSSAFGLSMWVERDAVEFTGAEPRIYRTDRGVGTREDLRVLRRMRHPALPCRWRRSRGREHDAQHEGRDPGRHLRRPAHEPPLDETLTALARAGVERRGLP